MRYFFVHVEKAAGTELRGLLKGQFPADALYPNPSDGDLSIEAPQLSVRQLLARWRTRRSEIQVITGHFPYATIELLDADFVTLSVLREPVERSLSHLRHYRRLRPDLASLSLEEIYTQGDPHVLYRDHMVKMFGMTAEEVAAASERAKLTMLVHIELGREHLERAKQNVARLDVLGLQERFGEFRDTLEARFGWRLGPPLRANSTPPAPASSQLRERIAADNQLDAELYEFARQLVEGRRTIVRGM